jgi:TPR repeat protein
MDYMLTAEKILDELIHSSGPSEYHRIIKDAFIKVQEQNDPEDWQQFFIAISQFASSTQDAVANVYLARCFISGLGVTTNIEHGFGLLKSQESCETSYALGHCYFNGLPPPSPSYTNGHTIQEVDRVAAFEYFRKAASYDPSISTQETVATIAEAQCIMARMLFQGDGVTQNSKEALHYLMLSAENNNM